MNVIQKTSSCISEIIVPWAFNKCWFPRYILDFYATDMYQDHSIFFVQVDTVIIESKWSDRFFDDRDIVCVIILYLIYKAPHIQSGTFRMDIHQDVLNPSLVLVQVLHPPLAVFQSETLYVPYSNWFSGVIWIHSVCNKFKDF